MTVAVLDASALLALLLNETGAEKVSAVLSQSAMSTVNLSEVVAYYIRHGAAEAETREVLASLPIDWVPLDEALAYDAGMLLAATRSAGLSLGDRACLALGRRLGLSVLTADRSWSAVASKTGVAIEVIR
jgi:ribonuclease VapC